MDTAQMLVPLLVGFVSAAAGGGVGMYVGQAVIKTRLDKMEMDFHQYISDHSVTSKEWKAEITKAVDGHKAEVSQILGRVVFRDQCELCGSNGKERHGEVLRRLGGLETSFQTCLSDLVEALRK